MGPEVDPAQSWFFPGFTQPCMPPLHNAQHGYSTVIFSLRAVRVTHDHGKDPKESGGPSEEENGDAEERGENEHGYGGPNRIESA